MDKTTKNVNNTETNTQVSKPVETVEAKKKTKRKFEWTPKRKAAFEKCVAARKNQIQTKPKISKHDSSSSSDSDLSSSSSEEYKKTKTSWSEKTVLQVKERFVIQHEKKVTTKRLLRRLR